jgi:rubrerythrin
MTDVQWAEIEAIEPAYTRRIHPECGSGWCGLIKRAVEEAKRRGFPTEGDDAFSFAQIKEKFGLLRVYCENGDEEFHKFTASLEGESAHVCEKCGAPGKGRGTRNTWIRTLCAKCAGKFESLDKP